MLQTTAVIIKMPLCTVQGDAVATTRDSTESVSSWVFYVFELFKDKEAVILC